MPGSFVKVTFEGLMLFRRDPNLDLYHVGILRAKQLQDVGLPDVPDHHFNIVITPDPTTGTGELLIGESLLDQYQSMGNLWDLEVVDASGNPRKGIKPVATKPLDRHDLSSSQLDFDWIVNMEELHGTLPITIDPLKPIIRMSNGFLNTVFKTDGVDLIRASTPPNHYGFIAETSGLEIGIKPGEALVLRVGDNRIFRVNFDPQISYEIAITNVADDSMPMPGGNDHFQVYYALLFPGVGSNDRYRLRKTFPVENSPNPPHYMLAHKALTTSRQTDLGMTRMNGSSPVPAILSPEPFKCGGITVGDGPLE